MLTQNRLKELLRYNPDTGEFTWRIARGGLQIGDVAGSKCLKNTKHYILIGIDCKLHRAHRLVWLYMFNYWPVEVDHINGDGTDNRLMNLRNVDRQTNCRNMRKHSHNTSGVNGVSWRHQRNRWRAYIFVGNKQVGLGHYESMEEAIVAREEAEKFYGFHENHGTERSL